MNRKKIEAAVATQMRAVMAQAHSETKRTRPAGAGMTPCARLRTVVKTNSGIMAVHTTMQ